MNREIRFRGKRIDNGEWIYGSLLARSKEEMAIGYISPNGLGGIIPYVDPKSVGQFTGLRDKNGVEIFEGDVIKGSNGSVNGVLWKWGPRTIKFEDGSFNVPLWGVFENQNRTHWFEIVGNIHDNKELLNEQR